MDKNFTYLSKELLRGYITMNIPRDCPPLYFAYNQQSGAWLVCFDLPYEGIQKWNGIHIPHKSEAESHEALTKLLDEITQALDQAGMLYRIIP